MDRIHIDGLTFSGKHGVFARERRVEQEFAVEVSFTFDTTKAGKSDKLKDTVDYGAIKECIRETIEGKSHYLIEKLADEIARKILTNKRVGEATVTIRKTAVWDNGIPGVTITRPQK